MTDIQSRFRIKDMAEEDRPREKLIAKGEEALTNAELLAILIGSGTPKKSAVELMHEVLQVCNNRLSQLSRMSIAALTSYNGIGEAKAVTIKAAAELGRRRAMERAEEVDKFTSSVDIYNYMRHRLADLPNEEVWVMLLNNSMRLIKTVRMSSGGLTCSLVDVRMLIKEVLMADATCFVLVHNHPSGSLRPSNEDEVLTRKVKDAADVMQLHMVDHIIVADGGFYSFMDEGKI